MWRHDIQCEPVDLNWHAGESKDCCSAAVGCVYIIIQHHTIERLECICVIFCDYTMPLRILTSQVLPQPKNTEQLSQKIMPWWFRLCRVHPPPRMPATTTMITFLVWNPEKPWKTFIFHCYWVGDRSKICFWFIIASSCCWFFASIYN